MFRSNRKSARTSRHERSHLRRLGYERCEERRLMAADQIESVTDQDQISTPWSLIDYADGVITINGTYGIDDVTFELDSSNDSGWGNVSSYKLTHHNALMPWDWDETIETFGLGSVNKIVFNGNGSNDVFHNNTAIPSEAYGGDGDDHLFGGSADDILKGEGGDDELDGGAGHDDLYGQQGKDTLRGKRGRDFMDGGDDKDEMWGGEDRDEMYGGQGRDTLRGGKGRDDMHGEDGNDTLIGGPAIDTMFGDEGDDTLEGDDGDDEMHGGDDADDLNGGIGVDTLFGDAGDDRLEGDDGDDEMHGGDDADDLNGGIGVDTLFGDAGNDVLEGGDDADTLEGGEDDDRLYGREGADTLLGGNGLDSLWGGSGVDSLKGGLGADRYLIQEGIDDNDTIENKTDEDVSVFFETDDALHHYGLAYTAGSWTFDEIVEVDVALGQLVDATRNNALLLTENGKELTFVRTGTTDEYSGDDHGYFAWGKDNGKIWMSDLVFERWDLYEADYRTSSDDEVHNLVLLQIGYNWDNENAEWGEWKDISGWHKEYDLFEGFDLLDVRWRHDRADFVIDGINNPYEDFAYTFAAFFAFENDETFFENDSSAVDSLNDIQREKRDFIEDWLNTLS